MSFMSRTPSLTPSRSSPEPPVQPDHFYGTEAMHLPPSPDSDGKTWLVPEDDPLAHRGIPVFKPTMAEFEDFEAYMMKVECWGNRSGIIKVIPPAEWTAALPPLKEQLSNVKIKTPIEQHMLGRGGLFRQENMEKRKIMSVREWADLCAKDEFRAPGVSDIGLHSRSTNVRPKVKKTRRKVNAVKAELTGPVPDDIEIKDEPVDDDINGGSPQPAVVSPPNSTAAASPTVVAELDPDIADAEPAEIEGVSEDKPKVKGRRVAQTREAREASLVDRAARDAAFLETFNAHEHWLPRNTKARDYTPEFCQKLERQFWRNCGLGKPAWYGADMQGSLFTEATKAWDVGHLQSTLTRLLPASNQGLPGVNTPYLYFGMWRATFAWHVEDMDLFSINYIHFGAPKFWYAIPQGRAAALEQTMRGYFPKDTSQCPQFLRHKSYLASPTLLAQSSCRPNYLVQQAGEFVITFPRGYHAGFNLGLNCAESVNFALDSWLELGKRAKACECISDSVRIDVDQLLRDRALEAENPPLKSSRSRKADIGKDRKSRPRAKRPSEGGEEGPKAKKIKIKPSTSSGPSTSSQSQPPMKGFLPKTVTLKLGPRPTEPDTFPCCLCISMARDGLLRVHDPPIGRKDADGAAGSPKIWLAHEDCANIVPETWVDEVESDVGGGKEKVVFGVDGIVKDRWNLKCSACTKTRPKAHGAPIQCTKGKCPKAFHVSCARDGQEHGLIFDILREVEKEVVLLDSGSPSDQMQVDATGQCVNPSDVQMDDTLPSAEGAESGSRVLKVIRKLEVQVLCMQHNPAVTAAKKANKQDRIRNELVLLPTMSRIKIRVSAGVFEVSLIRVIEETSSVEVLWDRGVKREFKWGSVVFGNTDGPIQQKPSEPAPEPERVTTSMPVPTYPSVSAATHRHPPPPPHASPASYNPSTAAGPSAAKPYTPTTQYPYPPHTNPYQYWSYQGQGGQMPYPAAQAPHSTNPYAFAGYYPTVPTIGGPSPHYNAYTYQTPYRGLHWQQPYQPRPADQNRAGQTEPRAQIDTHGYQPPLRPNAFPPSSVPVKPLGGPSEAPSEAPADQTTVATSNGASIAASASPSPSSDSGTTLVADLNALATLQPSQLVDLLRDNPALKDIVDALSQVKATP